MNGIFDSFDRNIKRKFTASCVDTNSGAYVLFNETIADPAKAIISSSSIPGVFPHQIWPGLGPDGDDVVCMDGGTVWNTNLVSAIERCREQVDDDSQITLDVIECTSFDLAAWE